MSRNLFSFFGLDLDVTILARFVVLHNLTWIVEN